MAWVYWDPIPPSEKMAVIPIVFPGVYPETEKELTRRMFEWSASHGASVLAFMVEAWSVKGPAGSGETTDKWHKEFKEWQKLGKSLEFHPDRFELVWLHVISPQEQIIRMWELTREGEKRILTEKDEFQKADRIESRFFDQLDWRGPRPEDPGAAMDAFMKMWGDVVIHGPKTRG